MRVAVEDGGDRIAVQGLFEPARPEEREDLGRLALHRRLDGSVMQYGDALRRAQARQRRLQLQRFVQRLLDEALDGLLTPEPECAPAEAAREAFDANKADAMDLIRVAVEHR